MRGALATTVLALGVVAVVPVVPAQAARHNPTRAQIARAVNRAKRSASLWATVNICDTKRHPNTLGIRAQMPALGFPSWLSFQIQLNYYSASKHRFVPISKGSMLIRLGRSSHGLQQAGASFSFTPHTGLLNANVNFIWRRSGRLLGQTRRRTTAGHPNADFGNPPHFSAKQCRIS
ncbi:MAG TPA: hypothetical protein VGL51_02055 [Solirubrobacteraceae bacterium]